MRAFRVAYDGAEFRGFQRQPHGDTVEDVVFDALRDLDVLDGSKPDGYAAAGRTDAGVSAVEQTVAFEAPDWLAPRAFNSELPASVRVWAVADAPEGFHATHEARRREYEYHLYAPRADGGAADDSLASEALDRLSGTHDVHNLTPDREGTERSVEAACERDGDYLVCTFAAGGFPREFVRRAVSLIAAVASGDRDPSFVDRVLSAERLQGPEGTAPAPPEPLLLRRVAYDLDFAVDEGAAASAREIFEERRVSRRTGARVAGRLRDGVSE